MRTQRDRRTRDVGAPKLGPVRYPNLRMGTTHTEAWLREPRVCTTRGCPERYVFRERCRTCHRLTELL